MAPAGSDADDHAVGGDHDRAVMPGEGDLELGVTCREVIEGERDAVGRPSDRRLTRRQLAPVQAGGKGLLGPTAPRPPTAVATTGGRWPRPPRRRAPPLPKPFRSRRAPSRAESTAGASSYPLDINRRSWHRCCINVTAYDLAHTWETRHVGRARNLTKET